MPQLSPSAVIKNYFTALPIIFPMIGLFHIGFFIWQASEWFTVNVGIMYRFRPVVMALYTAFWIGACFRKKRYATAYLVLTITMVCFFYLFSYFLPSGYHLDSEGFFQTLLRQVRLLHQAVSDILLYPLPMNILFSFIILLYYRRMQSPNSRKY